MKRYASWSAVLLLELVFRFHACCTFSILSMKSESLVTGPPTPKRARLFTARYPLEGGPKQLKLHIAVIIEDLSQARDNTASLREEMAGHCFVLFDFLPREPTSISTAVRLLTGGDVPGNLREKELRYLPPGAVFVGDSYATIEDMRAFTHRYPDRLSLLTNSCYSFCSAFIAHHRSMTPSMDDRG